MTADGPAIEVWIADAGGDDPDADRLSSVGRDLEAAVRRRAGSVGPSNLSHSGRSVVFAIARSPSITHLGVDVEMRRDLPRPDAFARRILAGGEVGGGDLVGAWTVKEAALKATREGLAGDPSAWRFDDLRRPDPRVVTLPAAWGPAANWVVLRAEVAGPAALALAARLDKIHSLEVWVRSVHGPLDALLEDRSSPLRLRWSPQAAPAAG